MMNRSMLVDLIKQVAGRIIKWSTVAQQSDRCGYTWATLPPGRSDEKISSERVRLIQQYGFRSKPPSGSEILVGNPRAGTINPVALGTDNLGYGPTDLEEGEVVEYGPAHTNGGTQTMRYKADGSITVDSAAAKDVVVNGGTKKVARVDDEADCGELMVSAVQVSVVPPVLGIQVIYTEPGSGVGTVVLQVNIPAGVAVVPPVGPALTVPLKAIITTGAPRFKA